MFVTSNTNGNTARTRSNIKYIIYKALAQNTLSRKPRAHALPENPSTRLAARAPRSNPRTPMLSVEQRPDDTCISRRGINISSRSPLPDTVSACAAAISNHTTTTTTTHIQRSQRVRQHRSHRPPPVFCPVHARARVIFISVVLPSSTPQCSSSGCSSASKLR